MGPDNHHHNVEWFGNTAAASGPIVVSQRWEKWTADDDVALVGPAARIRDRLQIWREAGRQGQVGSLLAGGASTEALRLLAEELL